MRGASAVQEVLETMPGERLTVLVVWEPVLATDIAPPRTSVLTTLRDPRAAHYWDRSLILSRQMIEMAIAGKMIGPDGQPPRPGEIVWDVVALYPPGARWETLPPKPDWYGYPVVDSIDELRRMLTEARPVTSRAR